ncbi:unnamed protein product [Cochlearia groenlandica]
MESRVKYNESPCIVLISNEECTIFEYNNAIDFRTLSQLFHDPIQQPLIGTRGPRKKLRPLQEMYVEMRRMSRWNKFQERVIRKLVNEVNSLSQFSQPPRQRRPRRHIGSPPTPESDIESPTFSTDDEDFDSSRYY